MKESFVCDEETDALAEVSLLLTIPLRLGNDFMLQVALNMDEGYDHSYFFIQTFVGKHIEFHAWQLKKALEASV